MLDKGLSISSGKQQQDVSPYDAISAISASPVSEAGSIKV
jgi:hypothetical protein